MKTTDEILACWETEGQYADWCAIDSYDPMDGTTRRLFVGTEEDAIGMMKAYYIEPHELAQQRFYRIGFIPAEDARAFFESGADELPDERGMYDVTETAAMLDVSRQRVHQLIQAGLLEGRKVGKTWYVYRHSVESRLESQRKPFERHELDSYLGDFAEDFDVDAILEEATVVDPRTGNRYWREGIDLAEICQRHDSKA